MRRDTGGTSRLLAALAAYAILCAAPAPAQSAPSRDLRFVDACAVLKRGDLPAALVALETLANEAPDNSEYAVTLADAYRRAARPDREARTLLDISARCPDDPRVVLAQAAAWDRARRWTDVERLLLPRVPTLPPAGYVLLASAQQRLGNGSAAKRSLEKARALHPDDATLWVASVELAIEAGQLASARRLVSEARARLPQSPLLHYLAALVAHRAGDGRDAVQVRLLPGAAVGQDADGWLVLAPARAADHFVCARPDSALAHIRRAADAGLDTLELHRLHARIWLDAGDATTALQVMRSREPLWAADPDDATLALLCEATLAADELADYARFLRLRAERRLDGPVLLLSGWRAAADHCARLGHIEAGIRYLQLASELAPSDAALALALGDALWDAGRTREAASRYRELLDELHDWTARRRVIERLAEAAETP